MTSEGATYEAIQRALLDLADARLACLAVLGTEQFATPQDRVRAAAELRLIGRETLILLDRISQGEDQAKAHAEVMDYVLRG